VQRLRSQWPVVKSPIHRGFDITRATDNRLADQGKVAPIAMDPNRESRFGQDLGQIAMNLLGYRQLWHARKPFGIYSIFSGGFGGGLDFSPSRPPATAQSVSAADSLKQPVRNLLTRANLRRHHLWPVNREAGHPLEPEKQRGGNTAVAQTMIGEIIGRLRHSSDLSSSAIRH